MLKALRLGYFSLLTRSLDDSFLLQVAAENPYFLPGQVKGALEAVRPWFDLRTWRTFHNKYPLAETPKRVGIIMAGNVPLVGLHDLLAVLMTGHHAVVKPSRKDKLLMTTLLEALPDEAREKVTLVEKVHPSDIDFLLATGSGNTARQLGFEFADVPKVIRSNRFSVAVLTGKETEDDYQGLAEDVLLYHGMGCRNVSNILVPMDFDAQNFLELFEEADAPEMHPEWSRLVSWERSILEMADITCVATPNVVFEQRTSLAPARPGVVHLIPCVKGQERNLLKDVDGQVQAVVGHHHLPFGLSQRPGLFDFADDVDTFKLLSAL